MPAELQHHLPKNHRIRRQGTQPKTVQKTTVMWPEGLTRASGPPLAYACVSGWSMDRSTWLCRRRNAELMRSTKETLRDIS